MTDASIIDNIVELDGNRTYAGRFLLHLDQVESTNTLCLEKDLLLRKAGLVVLADRQTGGRGSRGRTWEAGSGRHLFCSFVIHPDVDTVFFPCMTLLAGLAVFNALESAGAGDLSIKWPNDVLIGGRKVGGILCESRITSGLKAVVKGIGINISGTADQFPAGLRSKAITLSQCGIKVSRHELLEFISRELDAVLLGAREPKGLKRIFRNWQKASSSIGKEVHFNVGNGEETGLIEGIDDLGRLLVRMPTGRLVPIQSGRVDYQ